MDTGMLVCPLETVPWLMRVIQVSCRSIVFLAGLENHALLHPWVNRVSVKVATWSLRVQSKCEHVNCIIYYFLVGFPLESAQSPLEKRVWTSYISCAEPRRLTVVAFQKWLCGLTSTAEYLHTIHRKSSCSRYGAPDVFLLVTLW